MSDAQEPAVLYQKDGALAWITLNRPKSMNAINAEVRELLPASIAKADQDPEIRVILVKGAGPRAFCAGADMKEANTETPIERRQQRLSNHWIYGFERALKPIIAVVHGYCLGGGLEIATACDIRIAAEDAVMGFPEVERGRVTGTGGTQRLTRIVGVGRALDMAITGERISGLEANRIGLVSRVFPADQLTAEATKVAQRIAGFPRLAVQFSKESVRRGTELEIGAGTRFENDLSVILATTADRQEAMDAFKEKRDAKFTD